MFNPSLRNGHVCTFFRQFFILPLSIAASVIVALATFTASAVARGDSPVIMSGGQGYLCVLMKTDGGVKCWGASYGLGAGPGVSSGPQPKDTINLSGVVALAAGSSHNCALRNDGAVLCWGDNLYGGVGEAGTATRYLTTPQIVNGIGNAIGISTGTSGQHTCALLADFSARCWGYGTSGQLGNGLASSNYMPQQVSGGDAFAAIATGANHTCAVTLGGAVKCWGYNSNGQLGDGSKTDRRTPTTVVGLGGGVVGVTAGFSHSCALLAIGTVKCWGVASRGQLGNGGATSGNNADSTTPVDVLNLTGVTSLAAGYNHNCAALLDGGVKCWGSRLGAIGDGVQWTSSADIVQPEPSNVVGLSGPVVSLGTSWDYTCAVVVSGAVECWGAHPTGALSNAQQTRATAHIGLIADQRLVMAEYRHAGLDYYFITSRYYEKLLLKARAPDLQATGGSFAVTPTGLQGGGKAITRFYFGGVARGGSRGSHFYTLVDSERAALTGLNPSNAAAPRAPFNEGVDSFAFAPAVEGVGGSCAGGQTAVYRAFRGNTRFPDDPNHRFTTNLAVYNSLVTAGWDGEGVKMCAPEAMSASVPVAPVSATYRVTFETSWTQSAFPTQFPPGRHFSGLVGATHNDGVSLWDEGKLATLGIQNMAELGDKTQLLAEVNRAIQAGQAQYPLSGGGIGFADNRVMLDFEITQTHPRVSLVSMVAPSPTWFVGVSQLPLFNNQQWVDELTIPLEVYDAGTDSGLSFASPDSARNPHIPIGLLSSAATDTDFNRGVHRNGGAYIGTFSFKRIK